jgi:hypothetical protein
VNAEQQVDVGQHSDQAEDQRLHNPGPISWTTGRRPPGREAPNRVSNRAWHFPRSCHRKTSAKTAMPEQEAKVASLP